MPLVSVLDGSGIASSIRRVMRQSVLVYDDQIARDAELRDPWPGATTLLLAGMRLEAWSPAFGTWVDLRQGNPFALSALTDVDLSGGIADGYVLTYSGGWWIASPIPAPALRLNDLLDVIIAGPTSGNEVLRYNPGDGQWHNLLLALSMLQGVSIVSPSTGQVLAYNASTGLWSNTAPATPSLNLDALTDVTIASPANGQALIYESASSQWKNVAAGAATIVSPLVIPDPVGTVLPTLRFASGDGDGTTPSTRSWKLDLSANTLRIIQEGPDTVLATIVGADKGLHIPAGGLIETPTVKALAGAWESIVATGAEVRVGGAVGLNAVGPTVGIQANNATNAWNALPLHVDHGSGAGTSGIGIGSFSGGFAHSILANAGGLHVRNLNDTVYSPISASAFPVNSARAWKLEPRSIADAGRLLEEISPVTYEDLRAVLASGAEEPATRHGFVAEDVAAADTALSFGESDDLAVDPYGLLAVLWQAVKDLSARVIALEGAA